MKKILLIALIIGVFGCKNAQDPEKSTDTPTATAEKQEVQKSVTEADMGVLYKYYHPNPQDQKQRDENTLIEYAADKGMVVGRTPSGVYIELLTKGEGPGFKWGDKMKVNYRGTFLDGKEFDSSYKRNTPLEFNIGQMIPGWNEALMSRNVGDKFKLLIPSHMAYGKNGFPGFVPPDANLVFEIDIIEKLDAK